MTEALVSIDVSRPLEGMPAIEELAFHRANRHAKPPVNFPSFVHLAALIEGISHDV
jgi:hypothetical protein